MRKRRFAEEQIVKILKEWEAGSTGVELSRKYNVTETTLYRWKKKYGGMEVGEAKRLKNLEAENGKLKRLLADSMLEIAAMKDVLTKKW